MNAWADSSRAALLAAIFSCAFAGAEAAPATTDSAPASVSKSTPHIRKLTAVDADNHNILLNHPGMVTLVLGTSEDSQDAARAAGKVMYPLRGRPDFQLIVVVDLRNSLAAWVPALVLSQMRSNLDREAIALKPYFLKNGNKSDPRKSSCVIPEFSDTICPQLSWAKTSDDLRGILFGVDGREIQRWDKIDDMAKLQTDVRAAIEALIDAEQDKVAAAARTPGSKLLHPQTQHPALLPPAPTPKED